MYPCVWTVKVALNQNWCFCYFFDACITCLRMSAVAVRSCCSSPEHDREPSLFFPSVSFVWWTGSFSFHFVAVYLCKDDFSELTSKDSPGLCLAMISNFAKVLPFLWMKQLVYPGAGAEFIYLLHSHQLKLENLSAFKLSVLFRNEVM